MKIFFDEKLGLAVNVFSNIAIMLLLLGAYIFRPEIEDADKHSIETQNEIIYKKQDQSTGQIKAGNQARISSSIQNSGFQENQN